MLQQTAHANTVFRVTTSNPREAAAERWGSLAEGRGRAMADDACLVCFTSGRCDLDGAAKALAGCKLVVERRGDELAVHYPSGPVLRVAYAADGYVARENAEIAQMNPQAAALLPCEVRFEVLIDDLDAALQDYQTLFTVQEALVGATGGFVFNTWNYGFPWSE